ncbi:MAG: hypothetical protein ABIG30_03720 [Candidatus Aenigmatarchaeota archaeon]
MNSMCVLCKIIALLAGYAFFAYLLLAIKRIGDINVFAAGLVLLVLVVIIKVSMCCAWQCKAVAAPAKRRRKRR